MLAYGDFHYDQLRFVDHTEVPWASVSDIWVLPECSWHESRVIVTAEAVPWSVYVRFAKPTVPTSKSQTGQQRRSRHPIDEDILLQLQIEFPWLTLAELRNMLQTKTSVAAGPGPQAGPANSGGSSSSTRPVGQEIDEDVVARVQSELADIREDVAQGEDTISYFRIRVLGGEWSMKLFGKTTTDVGCYAKDRSTKTWCDVVGWPKARSFAVQKFAGVENARMLAEEVRRKSDFFMTAWVDAGSPSPFAFEDCKHSYRSPDEWTEWMDSLPLDSESCKAALDITGMCPRSVPA